MRTPAVFLDRDGTLIEDRGHLASPDRVAFYPDTVPALRRLRGQFLLFVVTHQNDVAKGAIRLEDARRVNDFVVRHLAEAGVAIREVYGCPHQRSDGCACMKPSPHFLRKAEREHGVDLAGSFVVGDPPADVEPAANAGARGVYVLSGHGEKHRDEVRGALTTVPGIGGAVDAILARRAAEMLRGGGLVAFPTETVYGLGADAENEAAVRRIFTVKGRPSGHPLIVHLADARALDAWAGAVPGEARVLAARFWPGPMTLILKRSARVSPAVTGGQDTVGLRVPAHPLARAMLDEFAGGVAAPSANRFGRVSPTTADHVEQDLGRDVEFVVDGGPCAVGVESTIVDLSSGAPAILRPGGVTREAIEGALGNPVPVAAESAVRAPGQLESHYAPRAKVFVASPAEVDRRARELRGQGLSVVVLALPESADEAARRLYALLRDADARGADAVLVGAPPEAGLGLAILDRLRKAAGPRP